jgi:hypothetical protein
MAVTMSAAQMYEQQIRSMPAAQRLELLALIANGLVADHKLIPDRPKRSLTDLEGLGKEIWEGVDAQEYVDKLRGPWPDEVP